MKPTQSAAPVDLDSDDSQQSQTPNVTPAEQQQYDIVVTAGLNLIFGKQSFPEVVAKLVGQKDNIAVVLGHTAAMILMSVNGGVKKQGKMIPADVMYGAGQEIVSSLCDLAVHLNLMTQAQFQKVYQAALFEGLRVWGQNMGQTGGITPGLQAQSQQDLAQAGVKQKAPAPGAAPAQPAAATPPAAAAPAGPGVVNQGLQGQ